MTNRTQPPPRPIAPTASSSIDSLASPSMLSDEVQITATNIDPGRAWDQARARRLKRKSEALQDTPIPLTAPQRQIPKEVLPLPVVPPVERLAPSRSCPNVGRVASARLTKSDAAKKIRDLYDSIGPSGGKVRPRSTLDPQSGLGNPVVVRVPERPTLQLPPSSPSPPLLQDAPSSPLSSLSSACSLYALQDERVSPSGTSATSFSSRRGASSAVTTNRMTTLANPTSAVAPANKALTRAASASITSKTRSAPPLQRSTPASPPSVEAGPSTHAHLSPSPPDTTPQARVSPLRQSQRVLRSPPADRLRTSSPTPPRPAERVLALRDARFQLEGKLLEMAREDRGPHVGIYDDTHEEFAPRQAPGPDWRPDGRVWISSPTGSIPGAPAAALVGASSSSRAEAEACLANRGGRNFPLHIFHTTSTKGWGLRSPVAIPSGSLVLLFTGEVIPSALAKEREERGMHTYLFDLPGGLWVVDAWRKGGPARFLNHSCEPNLACKVVDVAGRFCNVYEDDEGSVDRRSTSLGQTQTHSSGLAVRQAQGHNTNGGSAPPSTVCTTPHAKHAALATTTIGSGIAASAPTTPKSSAKEDPSSLQPVIGFFALRPIPAYEELTFDYFFYTEQGGGKRGQTFGTSANGGRGGKAAVAGEGETISRGRRNPVRGAAGRCMCGAGSCRRPEM